MQDYKFTHKILTEPDKTNLAMIMKNLSFWNTLFSHDNEKFMLLKYVI